MLKYLLILLIFFSACSIEKRCQRHISKAKELGCLAVDSFVVQDTVKGWSYDTVFIGDTLHEIDTFTLIRDGIETKTVIRWKERIVQQNLTKLDTIYKFKFKTLKEIKTVEKNKWWVWPALISCFVVIFLVIIQQLDQNLVRY